MTKRTFMNRGFHKFLILNLACLMIFSVLPLNLQTAHATGTMTVGPAELIYTDSQKPLNFFDGSPATLRKSDTQTHYFHYDGNVYSHFYGAADDPFKQVITRPTMDNNGYTGEVWIYNIYKHTDGNLLAFCHLEGGNPIHYGVGLAYSTDNGDTWEYLGQIVAPDTPTFNVGGVPYLVVGNYFYVYFNEHSNGKKLSVARALVSDVLSAAALGNVTTWYKYDGSSWTEDGLTGSGASVIPRADPAVNYDLHSDAAYSTALEKYMITVQTHGKGQLLLFTSTDGINWGDETIIDETDDNDYIQAYSWFQAIDGGTDDSREVGSSFYIYTPRKDWLNRYDYDEVWRHTVTITGGATTPTPPTTPMPVTNASYTASTGFSSTQGLNQWYYQQWNGSSYSNLTWDSGNSRWKGAQDYVLIGNNWQHPQTNDSVRVWKSPITGVARISGTVKKGGSGGEVAVKIMKNNTQVWPNLGWEIIGPSDTVGMTHDFAISVNQNDYLYFIVNQRGNYGGDTTHWDPTVSTAGIPYLASEGFANTQGTNHWSYQYWNGSIYTNMTWDSGNNRWIRNGTFSIVGNNWQHPHNGSDSVRQFTAPEAGTIKITGNVKKAVVTGGNGVNVKVLKNSTQIWPASGWQFIAYNDAVGYDLNVTTSVATNDVISFIVNDNGNHDYDNTRWDPLVQYQ